MGKNIKEQRSSLLKKVRSFATIKSGINWNDTLRRMTIRLMHKDKLINSDLLWAERAIERSKSLKLKLTEYGKADIATWNRILDMYNDLKASDFKELLIAAKEKLDRDLKKCDTDDQKKIVEEFHEASTMRTIKLKGLIKDVLAAEGVLAKKATKAKKAEDSTIINPVEAVQELNEVPVQE